MHLIIPFASALSEGGRTALRDLRLPKLQALLALLTPGEPDVDDELSLSPSHERALARALGIGGGADGTLALATAFAQRDGIDLGPGAWGRISPSHWRVGTEQVSLVDPEELALDEAESRALLEAVRELFESEGFVLRYAAPTAWYARHPSFEGLPCASHDRVIGRNVDLWLTPDPRARLIRRMQSEVQMLLYTHPINDEREARGAMAVNSFWLSGCGVADAVRWPEGLSLDERLRRPALAEDWFAWGKAWHALDAGPVADLLARAQRGEPLTLTLCGERAAIEWRREPRSLVQRLGAAMRRPDLPALLEAL
jgi:hypothetical protein